GPIQTVVGYSPPPADTAAAAPRTDLPQLLVVNKKQITIEYKVANYGSSGIRSVGGDLTRDGGRTRDLHGPVQDSSQPAPPNAKVPAQTVDRSVNITLPGEGVFGVYIVTKSGAGLSIPPPQIGTVPQMRVEVDLTIPETVLYELKPKPGRTDTLIVRWLASDRNLTSRPVTLEWSANKTRWETIADSLPN